MSQSSWQIHMADSRRISFDHILITREIYMRIRFD